MKAAASVRRRLLTPTGPVRLQHVGDGLAIANALGTQHRIRWSDVDRWLEAPDYLLLVTAADVGVIVPREALAPGEFADLIAVLSPHLGPPRRRRRTMYSDRGGVTTVVRIVALVIAGVFLIFLALGLVLWAIGYGATSPANPPPVSSQPRSTSADPAVQLDHLSAPLASDDVPANCANTATPTQPEWMCWDESGNPEWGTDELGPGCRMVPYAGNMYLDCEGASGPGR